MVFAVSMAFFRLYGVEAVPPHENEEIKFF
jgi:hypothetical protein